MWKGHWPSSFLTFIFGCTILAVCLLIERLLFSLSFSNHYDDLINFKSLATSQYSHQSYRLLQDSISVQIIPPKVWQEVPRELKSAVVTILPSFEWIPALEVFLYTFYEKQHTVPLLVCVSDEVYTLHADLIRSLFGKYSNGPLDCRLTIRIANETQPFLLNQQAVLLLAKLSLWGLPSFQQLLYVELDCIFLQNVDSVFALSTTSSVRMTLDWRDLHPSFPQTDTKSISDSVFLLQPRQDLFQVLSEPAVLREVLQQRRIDWGKYFPNASLPDNVLPLYYNVPKTLQRRAPFVWHAKSAVFILRYTGEKPWQSWSSTFYRDTFVSPAEKLRLQSMQRWDAHEYEELHNLWKKKYFAAREVEFLRQVRVFQAYHAQKCWKELTTDCLYYQQVRLAGPVYKISRDLDAPSLSPLLQDRSLQLALGEFGAMLAVASLPVEQLPPFVGFTSWKEKVKQNWKEGASIDWTKIGFRSPREVYFWYSLHHPDDLSFYEVMERHHPGMLAIFRELAPFPLANLTKPYHRYIYGNYFLMSTPLFLEYMQSARLVMRRFLSRYPLNGTCPYPVPTDTEFPEERCVGYLLERYLNLWADHKQLEFVFAVDVPLWRNS